MAIGLLRSESVPQGSLGDFHSAPREMRMATQRAADFVYSRDENIASLALFFAFSEPLRERDETLLGSTIFGAGTVAEIENNVEAAKSARTPFTTFGMRLFDDLRDPAVINKTRLEEDRPIFEEVKCLLRTWIDNSFPSPEEEWDVNTKTMKPREKLIYDYFVKALIFNLNLSIC
ncbi:hypothetical protein K432DRAFT_398718 [Lepidopterella palustris CBS 459.81]|uniref:Uncharacterized protein n=1 Tax=Lepidopterella palustris CBS 459.81 TaxID=1314670 RepID=A0A8E2DXS1_9PEZI|nr:hypothetical protein K432DRAFT_398718 [Lepidopterella palustris CBS 459.81]